ncbi:hypothetical protein OG539_16395 [Actinacidiphila glaucinigra]|uniref:hypothetical protein n=1 Tax=Actinacidiphila glaucinigra TaxID=235986 RepID=UPI003254FEAE
MTHETAPATCLRPSCTFSPRTDLTERGWKLWSYCSPRCKAWMEEAVRVAHLPESPEAEFESWRLWALDEVLNERRSPDEAVSRG